MPYRLVHRFDTTDLIRTKAMLEDYFQPGGAVKAFAGEQKTACMFADSSDLARLSDSSDARTGQMLYG